MNLFQQKDPRDSVTLAFDFSDSLAPGETIASSTAACTVYYGTDDSPSAVIAGATQNSTTQVLVPVQGGLANVRYLVTVTATLNSGRVLDLAGVLPVITAT